MNESSTQKEVKKLLQLIVEMHHQMERNLIMRSGVASQALLESAVASPFQSVFGQEVYPALTDKAARLCYGIVKNHCFEDGNKRTGLHAMLTYLYINSLRVKCTQAELEDLVLDVAQNKCTIAELSAWLEDRIYLEQKPFILPEVVVFAGPNGSGKSTLTGLLYPQIEQAAHTVYINADDIKREQVLTDLEAAQEAERQRRDCLWQRKPFCFETVLSTDRNLKLLQEAKNKNYFIRSYFVTTSNYYINIGRVATRVALGGHSVPVDKIKSRFQRSLQNAKLLVELSDVCNIYDNSREYPIRIFNKKQDKYFYEEIPLWSLQAIKRLTGIEQLQKKSLNGKDSHAAELLQKLWQEAKA